MNRNKAVKIVAELMDVLHRNGVDVDTPYVFHNFFEDDGTSDVIRLVLTGDGDDEEYGERPIKDRIARYSKLPKISGLGTD